MGKARRLPAIGTPSLLRSTNTAGRCSPQLITPREAAGLRKLYADDSLFRSTVNMAPKRYGAGQYRYFHAPYPEPIERLKLALVSQGCCR